MKIIVSFFGISLLFLLQACDNTVQQVLPSESDCWTGAGVNQISPDKDGDEIRLGRELIANTAYYLGPKGKMATISNGMNCQNCHLEAGTKPWGNNYGAVASTYPKFRDRSGTIETIQKRINDCIERSLNGKALDTNSQAMKAMVRYINWLGSDIPKGVKPKGSGIMDLPKLNRAADPIKGKMVYTANCEKCHGKNGEGLPNQAEGNSFYPPLWGRRSYNTGAGLFRISRFAGFVRNNMPITTNYHQPQLTIAESWDVAAYVNSQPRPNMNISKDWPNISKKVFDHPFGPYADSLTEKQHKYGPWTNNK